MPGKKFVIPEQMMPRVEAQEIKGRDGNTYLVRNDAMFTGFQHSCGEFSPFFRTLRDRCKILGNRCPRCHQLICPPFEQRCPQCNFVEMQPEEMGDLGRLAASAVIVFFAPSRFKDQVPFGIGYVFLKDLHGKEADTAMLMRVRTTQGMIKPGIFKKDTEVKVVFCNERRGETLDIFVVPLTELTDEQISKSPLLEGDISWDKPKEPSFPKPSTESLSARNEVVVKLRTLASRIERSRRAQADLANWMRRVRVKTRGGVFGFVIDSGRFEVIDGEVTNPDLILAIKDPAPLLPWLERGAALTNLVMEGTLWINKSELETITRLDRIHRSLRRDKC